LAAGERQRWLNFDIVGKIYRRGVNP
jgi:hypothetical protein